MARDATYIKTDTAITDTVSVLCFVALRKICDLDNSSDNLWKIIIDGIEFNSLRIKQSIFRGC